MNKKTLVSIVKKAIKKTIGSGSKKGGKRHRKTRRGRGLILPGATAPYIRF